MRAALALVAALAAPAFADDTFEAKADGAVRLAHIDDLVWPFVATCDRGDDTQQRQCRHLRDVRQAQLANATVLVDADKSAFTVGAWNAKTKSVPVTLGACIDCKGVEIDGKRWNVVGNADSKAKLYDNARQAVDENAAKAFAKLAGDATVQLVVKVAGKPQNGTFVVDVLGFRVATPCDGSIIAANPPASPLPPNKKACTSTK